MPKIIRILRSCSMKIFSKCPTVNIWNIIFRLVICIAKNLIWTTLKMIFSIFRFFCTLRFQIYKYCPIITNHTSMEILFTQLSDDVQIWNVKNEDLWLVLWSRVTNMILTVLGTFTCTISRFWHMNPVIRIGTAGVSTIHMYYRGSAY